VFTDGQAVREWYSGQAAVVAGGKVQFGAASPVALIAAD
jgi:alpha-amylase